MAGGWGTPRRKPPEPETPTAIDRIFREFELAGFPQPGRKPQPTSR